MSKQFTEAEAVSFASTGAWEHLTLRQRAELQVEQDLLCMPFDKFHEAIEKTLGRPVYTHEFGLNREGLRKELWGEKDPSTLEEIINLIPKDKRLIFLVDDR